MTSTTAFEVEKLRLTEPDIKLWGAKEPKHSDWPVVYILSDGEDVYVGESLNAEARLTQHLASPSRHDLSCVRVVIDDRFNKSACLDLESYLIQLFSGDGKLRVRNGNAGIVDADYYLRDSYREVFAHIFDRLRKDYALFDGSLDEIRNSDLFKLSPFKALNEDQTAAVQAISEGLIEDMMKQRDSLRVVDGAPGTGKTVVAIFLLKLLRDIGGYDADDPEEVETVARVLFTPENAALLRSARIGIVVPQQSLRDSMAKVFDVTPGLSRDMVLTPFEVGEATGRYDILIVDEAHRLNRRANQPSAAQNSRFKAINEELFGADDPSLTQLDWLQKKSKHLLLMLDPMQTVRPADLSIEETRSLIGDANRRNRLHTLSTQMRISTGEDYVKYIRDILGPTPPPARKDFGDYDLRLFDSMRDMRAEIFRREKEQGLSRLVAGYAWKWKSRSDKNAFDIEFDGLQMRWNSRVTDWIRSPTSIDEVGSIHTVQGYDLNYAGVIIGNDLRYDPSRDRLVFDRSHYFDTKGMENNKKLNLQFSNEDVLEYVTNIYSVLLTRGIVGTYVYACDPALREHLARFLPRTPAH